MKKAAKDVTKKVVKTTVQGILNKRVKDELDRRVSSYKKKIAVLAIELGLLVLGFNFFLLGVVGLISREFPEEIVYLFAGLIMILVGFILSKSFSKR